MRFRLQVQSFAARDPQLPLHEVDAGDGLRHGVLDLDAPVQLEEEELAPFEHELGRARADVADRTCEAQCGVAQFPAQARVESRRRRFLEHLLVAALHGAVALAQRQYRAVGVGEQLHLDVPGPLEVPLEIDAVVAEGRLRLSLRRLDRGSELAGRAHDAHAASAAAGRRLDDQRRLARLRDRGHSCARCDLLRGELVAARAQRLRRRADPGQAGRGDRLGEAGVLGEEAVARMNCVRAQLLRRAKVLRGVEVGGDLYGLVGGASVQRPGVVFRDDGDGAEAELSRSAENA